MLTQSHTALERWKGFDEAIDRWLEERHGLIVLLSDFASHQQFADADEETKQKLGEFQSLLIDYISAGHFEFYEKLIEEGVAFDDTESVEKARELLQVIEQSTQAALDFNDKYEYLDDLEQMAGDLSQLAEAMVIRFSAEDEMIEALHRAHTGATHA